MDMPIKAEKLGRCNFRDFLIILWIDNQGFEGKCNKANKGVVLIEEPGLCHIKKQKEKVQK